MQSCSPIPPLRCGLNAYCPLWCRGPTVAPSARLPDLDQKGSELVAGASRSITERYATHAKTNIARCRWGPRQGQHRSANEFGKCDSVF